MEGLARTANTAHGGAPSEMAPGAKETGPARLSQARPYFSPSGTCPEVEKS
ncbi:hypothetical protein DSM104635_01436 [Terricaulis silvestris]|uniref:Uncharacterized protein n=1 Tax=Terricaulis silvestris TaxID=2686094 RepID=A0A6I6MMV9_9CAUL|nr:hypothetical protein DSM104635_01436 [Terricaulis silvestris]